MEAWDSKNKGEERTCVCLGSQKAKDSNIRACLDTSVAVLDCSASLTQSLNSAMVVHHGCCYDDPEHVRLWKSELKVSDPYLLSTIQKHIALQHVRKLTGRALLNASGPAAKILCIYQYIQMNVNVCVSMAAVRCNIPWLANTLLSLYHHTVSLSSLHSVIWVQNSQNAIKSS